MQTPSLDTKHFFGLMLISNLWSCFSTHFPCNTSRSSSFIISRGEASQTHRSHEKLFFLVPDCEDIPAWSDVLLCQPAL